MNGPLFTVFTPTYNRAHLLHRVYESLRAQTCRDFEWVVVDDGSTDATGETVARWRSEADFPIHYQWQANGHKKAAFNTGVRMARGLLFLPADSDDWFVPDALERFAAHWNAIPAERRARFSGVCCLCQDEQGRIVGDRFPGDWGLDANSLEMEHRHRTRGEKWGCHRTDVLRAYPFPGGLRGHVPESVVWRAIARQYQTRYFNEPLRIYCQDAGDQLTRTPRPHDDAPGALHEKSLVLTHDMGWFTAHPTHFLLEAARWTRYRLHVSRPAAAWPRSAAGIALVVGMAPVGVAWWLNDWRRTRARHGRGSPPAPPARKPAHVDDRTA